MTLIALTEQVVRKRPYCANLLIWKRSEMSVQKNVKLDAPLGLNGFSVLEVL